MDFLVGILPIGFLIYVVTKKILGAPKIRRARFRLLGLLRCYRPIPVGLISQLPRAAISFLRHPPSNGCARGMPPTLHRRTRTVVAIPLPSNPAAAWI
jgi:hypothetical protein